MLVNIDIPRVMGATLMDIEDALIGELETCADEKRLAQVKEDLLAVREAIQERILITARKGTE